MIKIYCLLFLSILASGCVSVPTPPPPAPVRTIAVASDEFFADIVPGMDYQTVSDKLRGDVVTGYEADPVTGEFRPVHSKTLVSSEIIQIAGEDYQVDMYLPQGETAPVPFIFRDGVLSAKGTAALAELRVRAAADHVR